MLQNRRAPDSSSDVKLSLAVLTVRSLAFVEKKKKGSNNVTMEPPLFRNSSMRLALCVRLFVRPKATRSPGENMSVSGAVWPAHW